MTLHRGYNNTHKKNIIPQDKISLTANNHQPLLAYYTDVEECYILKTCESVEMSPIITRNYKEATAKTLY
jgi:hypothetical protein